MKIRLFLTNSLIYYVLLIISVSTLTHKIIFSYVNLNIIEVGGSNNNNKNNECVIQPRLIKHELVLVFIPYSLFYSLGLGATLVTSYCTIVTSDTITRFLSNNSTIFHNSTVLHHNSSTIMTANIGKY